MLLNKRATSLCLWIMSLLPSVYTFYRPWAWFSSRVAMPTRVVAAPTSSCGDLRTQPSSSRVPASRPKPYICPDSASRSQTGLCQGDAGCRMPIYVCQFVVPVGQILSRPGCCSGARLRSARTTSMYLHYVHTLYLRMHLAADVHGEWPGERTVAPTHVRLAADSSTVSLTGLHAYIYGLCSGTERGSFPFADAGDEPVPDLSMLVVCC